MDHYTEIYQKQTDKYHRMISFEDVENNLLKTIRALVPLNGKNILDLGSGTGRLPLLFKQFEPTLIAVDSSYPMLRQQQTQIRLVRGDWNLVQADIRSLPIQDDWAEVTTAGWAAGHFCGWYPDTWQTNIDHFVEEMLRVTKPSGSLFIMETFGTGKELPSPPTKSLAQYYEKLEKQWGFARGVIRTDYQFNSLAEAKENTTFFFGDTLAQQIDEKGWQILPEWTGVWHRIK